MSAAGNENRRPPVYLVEDDQAAAKAVANYLRHHWFEVVVLNNGKSAIKEIPDNVTAIVLLDLGLPDIDGLQVLDFLKDFRQLGIILLTGRSGLEERVIGLEFGADDYLEKPFELRELLARVNSLARRIEPNAMLAQERNRPLSFRYQFEGWTLDPSRRELTSGDGTAVRLTSADYDLLTVFLEHPNRVLSRDQILELAPTIGNPAFPRAIDTRIHRLRSKLGRHDPKSAAGLIGTVRNAGYIFSARVDRI